MTSFFGQKLDGINSEGYLCHSNTLKLLGKFVGHLEKCPCLMISVLRFFIFMKAFPFQSTTTSIEEESRHIISILLVPYYHKKSLFR
jgi:hypothetical protein